MHEQLCVVEYNTEITVTDGFGNPKPLWQENRLGRALRLASHELRIPFVTGRKSFKLRNHNLITNAGLAAVSALLGGIGSPAPFSYIALGTGTTAAAATDTALQTEISTGGLARASATLSQTTTSVANDTLQFTHTFTASASFAVTEEGILNAASGGTLLAHQVFAAVNVASGDSISITHSVAA